jgi:hypothetical protein
MNDPDLLSQLNQLQSGLSRTTDWPIFAFLLTMSFLAALFIAFLYQRFALGRGTGSQIHRSFPLIAIAVTAIFISIQFSLPLSLGLLGALSIVRFRTPIKQPEEIGFILLVIAAALCSATFHLNFLAGLLVVATVGLAVRRFTPFLFRAVGDDASLLLAFDEAEYRTKAAEVLAYLGGRLPRLNLDSVSSRDGEVAVTASFRAHSSLDVVDLERGLRAIVEPRSFSVLLASPTLP